MAHYLPPKMMNYFQPRQPLKYGKPITKRKMPSYHGIAQFVHRFKDPVPDPVLQETPQQRKAKRQKKYAEREAKRLIHQISKWDPKEENKETAEGETAEGETAEGETAEGVTAEGETAMTTEGETADNGTQSTKTKDSYKTLFVARLAYDITEEDLKNEFEFYGPIVKVKVIQDKEKKSRGYAFIEFESSSHLKEAYKDADGRKIRGRRILVDVERGRTVKDWKPRHLGGGMGKTRVGGKEVNFKHSGREPARSSGRDRGDRRDRDRDRNRDRDRGDRDRRDRDRGDRGRDSGRDRDRRRR